MNGSIKSLLPLRFLAWMIGYIAFGAACVAIAPLFGSQHVDLSKALDFSIPAYENQGRAILFTTRIPRIMLAFVAGIMIYISLDEILPTAHKYGNGHLVIVGVVIGMIVMSISLLNF